ncbi:MAG: molecular chaperone TorD family protein [Anaerolineae bacterium]|nr:molecular chaperone TorD family protein [Anaerolineae bacterium]
MHDQAAIWVAHQLAYTFLSKVYGEAPSIEFLHTLVENDLFEDWPLEADQAALQTGLSILREFAQQWDDTQFTTLKRDYARLFVGPGHLLAAPWESVYRSPDHIIFDEQTLQVRAYYQRFGMPNPKQNVEPDDHFGLEMGFIAHLSALALAALQHENDALLAQTTQALQTFLTDHVLCWSSAFLNDVQNHARTPYYQGVAQLTAGCLAYTAKSLNIVLPVV